MSRNHEFLTPGRMLLIRNNDATHIVIISDQVDSIGNAYARYKAMITTQPNTGVPISYYEQYDTIVVPFQWSDFINTIEHDRCVEIDLSGEKWRDFLPVAPPYLAKWEYDY